MPSYLTVFIPILKSHIGKWKIKTLTLSYNKIGFFSKKKEEETRRSADLNDAVAPTGHHQTSGRVHVHVADVVFPLVECSQWCSTEATQTHTTELAAITATNN